MRVAALYDIHGNLPALEAVLGDLARSAIDQVVVGGDVFPGPMPRESIAMLRTLRLPVWCINGNGDRVVRDAMRGKVPLEVPEPYRPDVLWNATELREDIDFGENPWPMTTSLQIPGIGHVTFCHATPTSDTAIFTRTTPDRSLLPMLNGVQADLLVCGHTHMQFDRRVGAKRIVNAGSVGMPFGAPGAYWAIIGPTVELRRTMYDLRAAADRVRATKYPRAADFAARNILVPPSEDAMLRAFEKVELRP